MPQEKKEISSTETALDVGQLIYTSFQNFGFSLLQSSDTPQFLQQSFIDKVVNARWDPHSPPSSDFRAAYVYQVLGEMPYTVFGWLYYDGQDDFGRSGVPYFLAYYQQGSLTLSQLDLCLDCLAKGPIYEISRRLQTLEELETISLSSELDYEPVRFGVDIPADVLQKSNQCLFDGIPIDWFVSQTFSPESSQHEITVYDTPVPEIILTEVAESSSDSPAFQVAEMPESLVQSPSSQPTQESSTEPVQEPPAQSAKESLAQSVQEPLAPSSNGDPSPSLAAQEALAQMQDISGVLQDFVNKTMGIQGLALISEEGQPICSVMGLADDAIQMLAGSMLYMTQISRQELEWSTCDWVTLRGPENYLMLRDFEPGIYLLIKSAKVPMGLLEGVVKRMINKLKEELNAYDVIAISADSLPDRSSVKPSGQGFPNAADVSELLKAVLKNEISSSVVDDDDDDITYRGRPTSS